MIRTCGWASLGCWAFVCCGAREDSEPPVYAERAEWVDCADAPETAYFVLIEATTENDSHWIEGDLSVSTGALQNAGAGLALRCPGFEEFVVPGGVQTVGEFENPAFAFAIGASAVECSMTLSRQDSTTDTACLGLELTAIAVSHDEPVSAMNLNVSSSDD